ncbi:hypothetical protein HDV06_001113 [Boothiomyces sp. JEL0866]|nr:hypothetical protein HDV06_001113 [Boothiomyces sp. JEL0866]
MTLRPKTINFEELFENFRLELLSLFLYSSQVNAIALYQMTFDCCTALPEPRSEMLLKAIVEFLTEHAVGIKKIILNSKNILEGYAEQWKRYHMAAVHINRACEYLNKQLSYKSNPYKNTPAEQLLRLPIIAHAHIVWQTKILAELSNNNSNMLVDRVLYCIQENRNGNEINDHDVKTCIDSLIAMNSHSDKPIALYVQEFEELHLKSTVSYYTAESTNLINNVDISTFIERGLNRYIEESDRNRRYLDASSFDKVLDAFKEGYIINHITKIQKEFRHMIENEDEAKSLLAYKIISKIPGGIKEPVEIFEQHITNVLVEYAQKEYKDPFSFLDNILVYHERYLQFVTNSFEGEHEFEAAMDKAFRYLINNTTVVPNINFPEIISKYFDHMLKKSSKIQITEQQLEEKLFKLTKLFVYIDEKDLFQKFYMRSLAKRLLYNSSTSNDIELSMISKLKDACGFEFTSKMQRMFTDVTLSEEINAEYKKVHGENDFHVLVLTTGSWPIPADTFDGYRLPAEIESRIHEFNAFYINPTSRVGRKLIWNHHFSRGEIKMNFYDKKYELSLSLRQLMVILPFNSADEYTIDDLVNITNFKAVEIQKILKSFTDFEILMQVEENFKINLNFTNKRLKLKLPAIAIMDSKEDVNITKKAVEDDRRFFIQAVIVRVMKAHQQMSHLALVDEVIRNSSSRFNPSIPLIKKCIEGLIEKQFIQRTEEKDQYAYIN